MLFGNRDSDAHEWIRSSFVHLLTAVCPLVDAFATVACLKPFRRVLLHCGVPPKAKWEKQAEQAENSVYCLKNKL